ncbi:MAG: hypothetical protein WBM44_05700 [Waterburya sp.]
MGVATLVAVFSFFNTIRLWQQTNRPIVSAFVETHSAGNVATMYKLLVINSGNRPAVNIRLELKLNTEDFKQCIAQEINDSRVEAILRCFSSEGVIPLLISGDNITNYFGLTSRLSEEDIWKYGSLLPIEIHYKDLEGKKYISKLTLVIKYSKAIAGMRWADKSYKREDIVNLLKQILDSIQNED